MRIGILIAGLNPSYGAEKAVASLAEGLSAHGAEVTVFLLEGDSQRPLRVPVVSMTHARTLTLLAKFMYAPVQYLRLRRAVQRQRLDVLISVLERSNILNLLLPRRHVKILSIRTFLRSGLRVNGVWRRISTRFIYRVFLGRADCIVTVSELAKEDFQDLFAVDREKIFVVNNPLNLDAMRRVAGEQLEETHRALLDGDSILHVGRFTRDKGQWPLIRAMPRVVEGRPGARLVLVGDGEMRRDLEQLVSDLRLRDRVHFVGYQSNPLKFMARAKLLVASSTREGFPNALVEALACGTPIVSTDCESGPRELLAPGSPVFTVARDIEQAQYGLLVPPLDPRRKRADEPLDHSEECLSRAVIRMLQDEELRALYSKRGVTRAEDFAEATIISRWMELLSRIAGPVPERRAPQHGS